MRDIISPSKYRPNFISLPRDCVEKNKEMNLPPRKSGEDIGIVSSHQDKKQQ